MYRLSIIISSLLVLSSVLIGQTDTHYWTHQYGAKGLLLNGAVIASPEDETSLFYNPGAIGQDDQLGFSFSFLTPTLSNLKTTNFLGEGTQLDDQEFGLSPGFLAVRFRPFKNQRLTAGVATFTRYESSLSFSDRIVGSSTATPEDVFRGEFNFKRSLTERWFGVGLAYSISDDLGIGLTQYSVWHDENLQLDLKKELYPTDQPTLIDRGLRTSTGYKFSLKSSLLTKIGIAYSSESYRFGLTFTSPQYGRGQSSANYTTDRQQTFRFDSTTVISNRKQADLKNYRTPMSVGFGAEVTIDKLIVSFSTEYFKAIDPYFIIQDTDDPFDGFTDVSSPQEFSVTVANKNVVNFALGFQRRASEKITWLWGLRTDFNQRSRLNNQSNLDHLASTPDIFHLSGGGTFSFGNNIVSFGVDYGFGRRSNGIGLTDLTNINRDNIFLLNQSTNVNSQFNSIMLFLTYDFIFSGIKSM